jgi:hypothetical protein
MGIKRNNVKNGICSAYCTILHQDVSTHQIKNEPSLYALPCLDNPADSSAR